MNTCSEPYVGERHKTLLPFEGSSGVYFCVTCGQRFELKEAKS